MTIAWQFFVYGLGETPDHGAERDEEEQGSERDASEQQQSLQSVVAVHQ